MRTYTSALYIERLCQLVVNTNIEGRAIPKKLNLSIGGVTSKEDAERVLLELGAFNIKLEVDGREY